MAIQSSRPVKKPGKRLLHRIIILSLTFAIIIAIVLAITLFRYVLQPNVSTSGAEAVSIFIPTGSAFSDVKDILYGQGLIANRKSFEWVAGRKDYPALVKPGHYRLKSGMSNNELVNMPPKRGPVAGKSDL
jgi:UPF0755 protein